MTAEEQHQLVSDICDNFKKNLLERTSFVPPSWRGAELKYWMHEYFRREFLQKHLVNVRSVNNDILICPHL